MSAVRKRFATQVNSELLSAVRALAKKERRQIQTLVDEAFADLIDKRTRATPRAHVMAAYSASQERYASLYKKFAT